MSTRGYRIYEEDRINTLGTRKIEPMISVLIPEGRESDTHSASPIFEKVGLEPNRFEIVFFFATSRRHLKAM
jgi:hypothetical protein